MCKADVSTETHSGLDNRKPKQGDFAVCWSCGIISRYTAKLDLVPASPTDLLLLEGDNPEGYQALINFQQIIKAKIVKRSFLRHFN